MNGRAFSLVELRSFYVSTRNMWVNGPWGVLVAVETYDVDGSLFEVPYVFAPGPGPVVDCRAGPGAAGARRGSRGMVPVSDWSGWSGWSSPGDDDSEGDGDGERG